MEMKKKTDGRGPAPVVCRWVAILMALAGTAGGMQGATCTWRAASGQWSDAACWAEGAVPTASDTAYFPAGQTAEITLTAAASVNALVIETDGSSYAFRSAAPNAVRTLTVNSASAAPADATGARGTLTFDAVSVSQPFTALERLESLSVVNEAVLRLPSTFDAETDLQLVHGGLVYLTGTTGVFGTLRLSQGRNHLGAPVASYAYTFERFEDAGGMGVAEVLPGGVRFKDTSGIRLIGGTQSLSNPGPRIPVAPQFAIRLAGSDSAAGLYANGWGLLTLDRDGVVREIPTNTMKTAFSNATELDNVYIGPEGATLEADVTVNAVAYDGPIDLNGFTLTVLSGAMRTVRWQSAPTVSNGTVYTPEPFLLCDGINNADVRFTAEIETPADTDVRKTMLSCAVMVGWGSANGFETFRGTVLVPRYYGSYALAATNAPGLFLEICPGSKMNLASNWQRVRLAGLGGTGRLAFEKVYNTMWLGNWTDGQAGAVANHDYRFNLIIGDGGVLAPGSVREKGVRRGTFSLTYVNERLQGVQFLEGATLEAGVHADGSCSLVDATATTDDGTYLSVALAGALVLEPCGFPAAGTQWTILKTNAETTGAFSSVTEGFKVAYNVMQDDGTYGLVVTRGLTATIITVQ